MAHWKVRVYKIEETACNVPLDVLTERGLNQMMLRCLFLRCLCVSCRMYSSLWLKLLGPSAFWYACTASSNTCLSDDNVEMRLLIDVGSCLKMLGGWLECLCMYNGNYQKQISTFGNYQKQIGLAIIKNRYA